MAYIKPVINSTCKQAQSKRLESQSRASKITLKQAIAQTRFILEHTGNDKTEKPLSGQRKTRSR